MVLLAIIPPAMLMLACLTYVFWTSAKLEAKVPRKTQLDHLRDRLNVVYDNLRDLNFEFRAGKYPESDYILQRSNLEREADIIMTQIDRLEAGVKYKAVA